MVSPRICGRAACPPCTAFHSRLHRRGDDQRVIERQWLIAASDRAAIVQAAVRSDSGRARRRTARARNRFAANFVGQLPRCPGDMDEFVQHLNACAGHVARRQLVCKMSFRIRIAGHQPRILVSKKAVTVRWLRRDRICSREEASSCARQFARARGLRWSSSGLDSRVPSSAAATTFISSPSTRAQLFDQRLGQPHGQAVTPFRNLHWLPPWYASQRYHR